MIEVKDIKGNIIIAGTKPKHTLIKVKIHLLSQSNPIIRTALNAYTKDGLYCLYLEDKTVKKYPLVNIFEITEN